MFHNINLKEKLKISVFNIECIRYDLIHHVVLWQQLNNKRSLAQTKTITKVCGSTKKIYRQKGTGRARHGNIKSSCFVGGGISFGPNINKNYSFKINDKTFSIALRHAISLKFKTGSIFLYNILDFKNLNIKASFHKQSDSLFIGETDSSLFIKSCNSPNLHYKNFFNLNIVDILRYKRVFFSFEVLRNILFKLI